MVLVDASVWIRFLSNRPPYAAELHRLLGRDDVAGHEFIYGELLMGDNGGRKNLLSAYMKIHQAITIPHLEVAGFVHARKLNGRGVGWLDAHLLASAIVEGMRLWTADRRLSGLAKELNIAFEL